MSEKINFIDETSGQGYRAHLLIEVGLNVDSPQDLPDEKEMEDLMKSFDKILQPMVHAKGRGWHISSIETDTFPTSRNLRHPFSMIMKLAELLGSLMVWTRVARALHGGFPAMAQALDEVEQHLAQSMLKTKNAVEVSVSSHKDQILEHAGSCESCRKFLEKYTLMTDEQKEVIAPKSGERAKN